ncbi:holo-ACP synthase [Salipaludibacillus sp. CUR1]|uniref:holo-ACP synthase n=1 Tax=Salipaludibacillus sp. CUR1 TaxID=2820003 RepID=UPI001E39CF79|nr:holo-ACP synthase [Salipaludibacillus sp. CUR1]MCE7794141.1 holo-ACP synthase [Salipaludibacillus sp. CUR1]
MIQGIGLDVVSLDRIARAYTNNAGFADRILTGKEKDLFKSFSDKRKIEFLAGRFAAKEAYAKALGCGIGKDVSFQDIEILSNEKGKPELVNLKDNKKPMVIHLSITHTNEYAAAQVVIENRM